MDVNQTRFHHWLVADDWIDASGRSAVGDDSALEWRERALQRRSQLRVLRPSPRDRALEAADRRGMVLLASGAALIVGQEQRAILEIAPDGCWRTFWRSPDRRIGPLILDDEGRLLVILQPERAEGEAALLRLDLVEAELSAPTSLGEGEVLDATLLSTPAGRRLAILRANGRRIALYTLAGATSGAFTVPVACAVQGLPDGTLALLRAGAEGVVICRRGAEGERSWPDQALAALAAPLLADGSTLPAFPGHALLWVPGAAEAQGRLLVCDRGGNQAFALSLRSDAAPGADWLTLAPELYPLTHFGGRGLVAGSDGQAWFDVEVEEGGFKGLAPVIASRRRSYDRGELALTLRPADSGIPGCTWHRIVLEAQIPPGCGIVVEARVSEDTAFAEQRADGGWVSLPALARRSRAEIGGHRPELPVWDALLVDLTPADASRYAPLQGRWLQLRLRLHNTANSTPRIASLRAWYPRFSYLERYLPAIWREVDPDQNHFAERFLANVEGLFTELEERLVAATMLFDPRVAPPEVLPWLASWFALTLDPGWSEPQRRFFLRHAIRMFNMRGTCAGVAAAVRLAMEPAPSEAVFESDERLVRLREHFRQRVPGRAHAHRFTVSVLDPQDDGRRVELQRMLSRVLAVEKPAHTAFEVRFHVGAADGQAPEHRAFELDDSALNSADRLIRAAAETLAAPAQTLDHIALGEGHLTALPELPDQEPHEPEDVP